MDNSNMDPLGVLPRAIRTMLSVAKTNAQLGVARRSAENALLYSYLWNKLASGLDPVPDARMGDPPVIVIDDKNHGFRWYSPSDFYEWMMAAARSSYIVWNMASPLAEGPLWSRISQPPRNPKQPEVLQQPELLKRVVLLVDEDELRHAGVDLRRAGSSERTFQEFWEQLYTSDYKRRLKDDSPLAQLTGCKALVICFDGGVLVYSHDGGDGPIMNEALRMYGLHPKSPNGQPASRPERSGQMFGRDIIVTTSITLAIELGLRCKEKFDLLKSVDYGCRLSVLLHRMHLDAGYAPASLNQAMYSALRPQPFSWLFEHWFEKHPLTESQESGRTEDRSNPGLDPLGDGQICSPFEPVADQHLETLRRDHSNNLDRVYESIKKDCSFTRLSSYLSKSDRESRETLSKAFRRFQTYSRIEEFHIPVVLDGPVPAQTNRQVVESFASIDPAAARIVTHGLPKAIQAISAITVLPAESGLPNWVPRIDSSIPSRMYNWLTPLLRSDIDNYNDVSELVQDYVHDENRKRPLSLAVFGAPGSGKNTTIEALIAATDKSLADNPCTFNLSQFNDERDLATAFHQVQDLVLTRKDLPPVVFFDEFDSSFQGDWGWFKYFLAPMQDGQYRSGENTYHIGRAIFVFSGGISQKYSDFERNMTSPNPEVKAAFERAKGPDFVSRLRGHLDIPSINMASAEQSPDDATKIRRALILRSILQRTLPQIYDQISEEVSIDPRIIKAMLGVPRFRHEVRSMQAIIEMSHVPKRGREFSAAELPSECQLSMHVESLASFYGYLRLPR